MGQEQRQELEASIYTGLIDKNSLSLEGYRPKLLVNDAKKGQKVLTSLIAELNQCDEFFFSVAFITESGVTVLLDTLKELEVKDIKGKIVASQYLNFTNPKALRRLLQFTNIDLRIVADANHHSKGYIFRQGDLYSLIVGSSNLTQNALGYNKEWNLRVASTDQGSLIEETLAEFNYTHESATQVTSEWITQYQTVYDHLKKEAKRQSLIQENEIQALKAENQRLKDMNNKAIKIKAADQKAHYTSENHQDSTNSANPLNIPNLLMDMNRIMPNKMQVKALSGIQEIRQQGESKALLVSATGTGKTYLAAFDVNRVMPKRLLFLAHREQLLNQSIESFKHVMGHHINCGKLSGSNHDTEAQYLFSTVQSMSKMSNLESFAKDAFDYIIIDESHRAGSESYQRILNHFDSGFLLGMTATPERTDDHNICADFDYNIAYEIRLQEAMEENMLCPFHYFGVSEISVDGELIDDMTDFSYLTSDERLKNIYEKIEFYGHQGDRVRGLIFCGKNDEAEALSKKFNEHGFKTVALSGKDDQLVREQMISLLESEDDHERLDYIFTVDIFNDDCAIIGLS